MRSLNRSAALATVTAIIAALAFAPTTTLAEGKIELNIGSLAPKGTPWMELLEDVESMVEKDSGGRINVIIRPPGIMGEVEMVRETRKGERLQGAAVTTAAIAEGGNIPQLSIVELPFLFNTNAEADHLLDNVLWDPFTAILEKRGFKLGIWSENGWRSFATKGEPIRVPEDVKKHKMRSQESDVHVAMYKSFGVTPIQKPMTAAVQGHRRPRQHRALHSGGRPGRTARLLHDDPSHLPAGRGDLLQALVRRSASRPAGHRHEAQVPGPGWA